MRTGKLRLGWLVQKRGVWKWEYLDELTGKTKQRSTGEADQAEAKRIADRWAAEEIAVRERLIAPYGGGVTVTISDAAIRYYSAENRHWSKDYAYNVAYYIDSLIIPYFGENTLVVDIKQEQIAGFKIRLLDDMRANSANKVLCTLRKILSFCAENGFMAAVPVIKNIRFQREQHGRALTPYEMGRVLVAARRIGPDALRFVGFGLFCGLRKTEILGLTWDDINWDKDLIILRQKNKTLMPAPLGRMRSILERVPHEERLGNVVQYVNPNTGERRPASRMERTWRRIRRESGVKGRLRFHDLRHTFIDECYRTLSPALAPVFARHSALEATARYIHLDRDGKMVAARNLYR